MSICLTVSTQYWRVTDRQADRQAACDIIRAMHTHRAVKTNTFLTHATIRRNKLRPTDSTKVKFIHSFHRVWTHWLRYQWILDSLLQALNTSTSHSKSLMVIRGDI